MVFKEGSDPLVNRVTITIEDFDPTRLRDQIVFETALNSFEQKLFDPLVEKSQIVDDLMSAQYLFELVFSGTPLNHSTPNES